MSTIVTRSGKGSPLTHVEVDANFTNLNTDKYQSGDSPSFATLIFGADQSNYGQMAGGATTKAVVFKTLGSDTNISQVFQSKGTGAIDLAAGSAGVNISNGGTVTAITRTANGSAYTSTPAIAITAPTTAGGVQATATANMFLNTVVVAGGGTGYIVNDVLTLSGGTSAQAAQVTVTAVSAGVITAVSIGPNYGYYSVVPTSPVSVTGGTGTGATFTVTWGYSGATITNAGSGYVEQPTVSFSGGGGSGAAAYATVGSGTVVRGIGPTTSFYSPAGETLRLGTTTFAANAANYVTMLAGPAGNPPWVLSQGSDTNIDLTLQTKGTGNIVLGTGQNFTQAKVAHTASAVNYVQVTGAATGGYSNISAQGSDTNTGIVFQSKGTGYLGFAIGASNAQCLRVISGGASGGNLIQIAGSAAGAAPSISVANGVGGSDTNIDLALTPKGTGVVQFGSYTAGVVVQAGYITVKDSSGTTRRLLVG